MKITTTAKHVAEKTQDAYSFDRYSNWDAVAQALIARGYNEQEAEAIMRSKWTRWAADAAEGVRYGKATSSHLVAWMDKTFLTRAAERKDVNVLVKESF